MTILEFFTALLVSAMLIVATRIQPALALLPVRYALDVPARKLLR